MAKGVPAGLGEPVFDRLDADLAKAVMCIPAVKGVEIGAGFESAIMTGSECNDEFMMKNKNPVTIGDGFEYLSSVANNGYKFVSLSILPGGEGSNQIFLAMTIDGYTFVSEDLKLWEQKTSLELK